MKNFEKDMERLEAICHTMREGKSGLEESMKLFEEGIQLVRALEKMLHQAEQRIEMLVNEPDEKEQPIFELFGGAADDASPEKSDS